jgi:hypothetical protein
MTVFQPEQLQDNYLDFTRTDRSRYLRGHIRVLYMKGQQLWDSFANNNFYWWQWWMPRYAFWRRDYPNGTNYPPWYTPTLNLHVRDPKQNEHWSEEDWHRVYFFAPGMPEPIETMPIPGCTCYVMADRMVVIFADNEGWVPLFRLPQYDKNFELAAFADHPKSGKPVFRHTVSQAFKIFAGNIDCRLRGWSHEKPPLPLYKNDSLIGYAYQTPYSSGVTLSDDVVFAEGDVIEARIPSGISASPWIALSIIGSFYV